MKTLVSRGLEKEWATDYIEGLSLKGKLESALKIHFGWDISTEPFYKDLKKIIKLKSQITMETLPTKIKRKDAIEIINIIETVLIAISQKSLENGLE